MEFVDLYDGDRNFTGKKIVRGEKYEEGLYKLSVHIWITNNEGKIYIQKRAESRKMFPNYWENPGGGVISGQDSETTLKREFEEELGIPMSGKHELIKSIKRKKILLIFIILLKILKLMNYIFKPKKLAKLDGWILTN